MSCERDDWRSSSVWLCRPERRFPQWTQSSTPRGFTISSPQSSHSFHEQQGEQRHMEKGRQVEEWSTGRQVMERKKKKIHQQAELLRCCDGFVSLSLIHSPSSSLHFSFSLYQRGATVCSYKNIIRLHLICPLFLVHVLLWMIRVLNVSISCVFTYIYNLFVCVWLLIWDCCFFIASM